MSDEIEKTKEPSPYMDDFDKNDDYCYETLIEMLLKCKGVTAHEIKPCQSIKVETQGKPALLIVKEA